MKNTRLLLIAILLLAFTAACLFTANAQHQRPPQRLQQPATMEAELGPPIASTEAQSGGVRWVAYGYLYPVGTFDNLPPCTQPEGVAPIGSYKVAVEWGNASFHAAQYRVTFGHPNDGKQFVFGGIVEYTLSELNLPEMAVYSAARLVRGNYEGDFEAAFTPRDLGCLGGRVVVQAQSAENRARPLQVVR